MATNLNIDVNLLEEAYVICRRHKFSLYCLDRLE